MNSDWSRVRIDEIGEVKSGKRLPLGHTLTDSPTDFPYIRLVDIADGRVSLNDLQFLRPETRIKIKRYVVNSNDVCLAIVGHTIGLVFYIDENFDDVNLTENAARITSIKDLLNPKYLYYYFTSPVGQAEIQARKVGSAQGKLPLYNIKSLEILIPSRETQDKVVALLDALDNRITLLRESNTTLEAIAQALFKSWFVDFDPVRAKVEGLEPEGMDAATAALFPESFEESELGLVPNGWNVRSVYDVARVIYGAPFASKRFNTEGVGTPLVRIRDLKHENPGVYTDENHPKGYMIQPGDLVVGMDGEFRAYLWGGSPAWLNQRVCVFAPEHGVPAAFVHRSIMPLLAAVEASETATTVIHLGKNDIDRFRVVVPNPKILESFGTVAEPIYVRIVENKKTAFSLSALRDTLLPRLISGQLRLPEAEEMVEEAYA